MNYKLTKPFKYGNETISEIEIKEEYNCGDMVRIQNASAKGDGDIFLELVVVGTGFPAPKASLIPARDALKITGLVKDFLDLGAD